MQKAATSYERVRKPCGCVNVLDGTIEFCWLHERAGRLAASAAEVLTMLATRPGGVAEFDPEIRVLQGALGLPIGGKPGEAPKDFLKKVLDGGGR